MRKQRTIHYFYCPFRSGTGTMHTQPLIYRRFNNKSATYLCESRIPGALTNSVTPSSRTILMSLIYYWVRKYDKYLYARSFGIKLI